MNRRLTINPLSRSRPVVHYFKREASAKEGATNGGLYMERRASALHTDTRSGRRAALEYRIPRIPV